MAAAIHLYELADEFRVIDEWLIESGGELTPEIEQLLKQLTGSFEEKVERIAVFIEELGESAEGAKHQAARLTKVKQAYANGVEKLKRYLAVQMAAAKIDRVKRPLAKVRLQTSNPAVVGELDQIALESLYLRRSPFVRVVPQTIELDKAAVVEAWKAGQPIPDGLAVTQGKHVVIA